MDDGADARFWGSVSSALAVTVASTMPLLLAGALAVQLQRDLSFTAVGVGGAIAVYRASGTLLGPLLGRATDRIGAAASMRVAAAIAAVTSVAIALFATDWLTLAALLAFGGTANVLGQSGANASLSSKVPMRMQAFAFGLKQSALPLSGVLAGLSVPLIALTVGWRWAFVANAVLAVAAGAAVRTTAPGQRRDASAPARPPISLPTLLLAAGLFFGMGAASTLSAFTVDAAVVNGMDPGAAGLLLTVGSATAILVRLIIGFLADRHPGRQLPTVALMLFIGSIGYVLLALPGTISFGLGVAIAFGFGWGFNGLFWYSVIRLNADAPGRATGSVMPGGMAGGVAGPLLFAWVVDSLGYSLAWTGAAAWGLIAGALVLTARRAVDRQDRWPVP
jgi:MFS family permease